MMIGNRPVGAIISAWLRRLAEEPEYRELALPREPRNGEPVDASAEAEEARLRSLFMITPLLL